VLRTLIISRTFAVNRSKVNGLVIICMPGSRNPAHRRVLGIAGDEQDLQPRPVLPADFRQLPAVHAGQADVADHQVDTLPRIENRQRGGGIVSLDKGIAQLAQHGTDQHAHRRVVLDDQYRFAILREQGMLANDRIVPGQVATEARQEQADCGALPTSL
jgi:hypothetical protein